MTSGRASRARLFLAGGILVDPDTFVREGALRVEGGRVRSVRSGPPRRAAGAVVEDLRPAWIVPGLVDAHAHLDLTRAGTIAPRASFAEWLRGAIAARAALSEAEVAEAALEGASALLERGTTAAVDTDGSGHSHRGLAASGLRAVALREVIAPDPALAGDALRRAERWIRGLPARALLAGGLAPHAPYTVSERLYALLARLARGRRLPFSTHLAETPEEAAFLLRGAGPLRDLLEERGRLPSGWRPPERRPLEILERAGALRRGTLLAHANDLTAAERARIARAGATVVVCPGTHLHFRRPAASVRRLFEAGVALALGTDGRASNDRLDLFEEMARLRSLVPRMPAAEAFRAATANGGDTPGFPPGTGTLAPGSPADFLVLDAPGRIGRVELLEWLVGARPPLRAAFVAGARARAADPAAPTAIMRRRVGGGRGRALRPVPR